MSDVAFKDLVGKTLTAVLVNEGRDQIRFECTDGSAYVMLHNQDCCESVNIEDIAGDLSSIIGSPVVVAEESSNSDEPKDKDQDWVDESFTWTFYKIDTEKGGVTIRWYGSSNGYYSERVDFERAA